MVENESSDSGRKAPRLHRLLLLLPFVWQLALAPLINDVVVPGLPVPFPMLWQMIGVVLTSALIAIVFSIDRRHDSKADAGSDAP
jgi:hypothetical protein